MSPIQQLTAPLHVGEYLHEVTSSNQLEESESVDEELLFGFTGEVGGILTNVKKSKRDTLTTKDIDLIGEELGDSFWYFFAYADASSACLDRIIKNCLPENAPEDLDAQQVSFSQIYSAIESSTLSGKPNLSRILRSILAEIGKLATGEFDQSPEKLEPILSDILRSLVTICYLQKLSIDNVLRENISKITGRWPKGTPIHLALFDEQYPPYEQFPRKLTFQFRECKIRDAEYCYLSLNGVNIGGRLTDNSHEDDGYRFHDVFHMAYLVHLGWSPVLRALLKLKRKSDPQIDENEDSARAIIIEEGIATWIFNHAKEASYFKGMEVGKLSYSLLKQIRDLVSGYEVEQCPPWQWERAILDGFSVFNELKCHKEGFVTLDLIARTLSYSEENPNAED